MLPVKNTLTKKPREVICVMTSTWFFDVGSIQALRVNTNEHNGCGPHYFGLPSPKGTSRGLDCFRRFSTYSTLLPTLPLPHYPPR